MGNYYGYNRVSTEEQHLERGRKSIEDFCEKNGYPLTKIYEDKCTGKHFNRPRFIVLSEDVLREGDTLIVPEYDRLGRADETRDIIKQFKNKGIRVIFLDIPTTMIDLSTYSDEMSKVMLDFINEVLISVYDLLARTELDRRQKRQREGIEAKKARGEWDDYGRPRRISAEDFAKAYQRVLDGELSGRALMRELGLSQNTYYRYVREVKESMKGEKKK